MSYDPTHDETGNIFEVLFPFHDIDYGELRSVHGYSELENDPMFRTNRSWNFLASWTMKEERLKRRRTRKLFGLYMFPNLPLDLILEILTHLHPLDLYNVARANKALRALLLTRNASYNVWKTAFERHPSLPRCPPDLSEPCWTTLLFGPVICDECGRHGALVNFAYRRHFCSKCFASRSLFTIQGASDRLYEESNIVWQLVPYTIADNSHSFSTRSFEDRYPFYFKRPLDAIALATAALRKSADQGEAEAEKALETFVTMRQEQAARLVQQEEEVIDWGGEIYSEIVDELAMKHQNLMRQIKLRLIEEGHDRRDINLREPCYEFARNFSGIQLTSFVWKKVRPLAEAKITENRETRLAAESRHRPSIIEQVYCQYQKTVSPKLWKYLPSSCNLLKYDLISALATSSSDSTLESSTYADVIAKLPVYIADWRDWHRKELLKAMPNTSDIDLDDLALSKSKLGLSTSMFTCMRCKPKNLEGSCFVGGEAVEAHVRCGGLMAKFEYNAIGSGVAAELAELLQLDPSDTTVGDMDRLDARFLCGNCPLEVYRGARGHKVFTWRECIAHANYMHVITDPAHLQSFWYLLTPEATDIFRHHERQYPHPFDDAWSCTHCSIHFSNYVNRQKALDHVKNAHSIPAPKEDVDFFYDPSPDARLTPRRPAVLREAPLAQYRCKLCSRLFYRLFSLRSLEQHLMHKHRITSPVPDEHFTHVKLVGASLYY